MTTKIQGRADDGSTLTVEEVLEKMRAARDMLTSIAESGDLAIDNSIAEAQYALRFAMADARRIIKEGR